MKKHLRSLREYVEALHDLGDVREVGAEVDTHLEIGAVIRRSVETEGPAPLFTNIRGYRRGFRVFGAPGAYSSVPGARWARAALSLGLDPATHPLELVRQLADARTVEPVPPVVVDDAPCQQHVLIGDAASLDAFPVPLIHDGDGGRYVNTWGTIVVRTPDGTWTNWSISRIMMVDGTTMTGLIMPRQDIGLIYRRWQERGEPMPFALAQGCEPAVPFICGMGLPPGTDEAGYLGGYFGEPLEVTRCVSVDLEVPASAEIVIEGHVSPTETAQEGPMGEFLGYLAGVPAPRPAYQITAITHRTDPILPVVSAGKPVDEDHTVVGLTYAAEALHRLRTAGLPVTDVWIVPESSVQLLAVTVPRDWARHSLAANTRMLTRMIAEAVMQPKVSFWASRVMVLDDDIDPSDLRDLVWAYTTRSHPTRGQVLLDDQRITPLHLFYSAQERAASCGPKMAYDCLLDPDPDKRVRSTAFADNFPPEVRERVLAVWER